MEDSEQRVTAAKLLYRILCCAPRGTFSLPFSAGSNSLYLSVYSEYGVDVFDIHTAEWVQTISLRKVQPGREAEHGRACHIMRVVHYPCLSFSLSL